MLDLLFLIKNNSIYFAKYFLMSFQVPTLALSNNDNMATITLSRISEGEYKFENDKWVIAISRMYDDYAGKTTISWFASAYKKFEGNLEHYPHIEPTSSLRYMKEGLAEIINN